VGKGATLDPSRGGRRIIERPRLTRLLTESESRVMLLVAPAGYGKTTLARQWLADRPHVWYQATPASSDVAALALGVITATSQVIPEVGESVRGRLQTLGDAASEAESLSGDLVRDLDGWPSEVRLVVDDYQLISEASGETFIETLVASTSLPFLIISRSRPSWVTAKSLLYGDVVELGRNVLAMTHEEAAEALAGVHEEVPGLVALAEGWPAVIGLAALVDEPFAYTASEIPETLHEYLAEELYDAASPDIRRAAVCISIAPLISDAAGNALFGERYVERLEQCHRAGFLTKAANSYEMHPLVRQFLRAKWAGFGRDDLHKAAFALTDVYAEAGCWDEAASVAAEFGLMGAMLRVLNDTLDVVLSEGRLTTLRRWLETVRPAMPAEPIVQLTSLEIDFRTGDWATASSKANQLASAVSAESPLASRVYLRAGQMAHIGDRQDEALRLFTEAKEQARSPKDLRNALWSRLLTLCDLEHRAEAETTLAEIQRLPVLGADDVLRTAQARLQFATRWGSLVEALLEVAGVLDSVNDSNDPLVRTGFLQTYGGALGLVARYVDAMPIARRQLQEAERYHLDWVVPHALQMGAVAQMGTRKFETALKSIDRAVTIAETQENLHTQVNGLVLRARVDLCRGSPERAVALLEERDMPFTSPGMEGEFLATYGFALACCGRVEDAYRQLKQSESVSGQVDAVAQRALAYVIASHRRDNEIDLELYDHALATIKETGNFNAFVCAYRAFPPLLAPLRRTNDPWTKPFVDLVAHLDEGHAEKIGLIARAKKKRRKPLTPREREVFELMCQGLSNRAIGKTLWISESTAKVHVHHVLAKLGVHTRTEAVALGIDDD
jgi:LuxR family transcriptional regulator, maltose regulon positive regulatory protein